eukprot:m.169740 g.169740  ORF g.169740 m.169740 type:complete len:885 (+) comp24173_c0_seq1:4038-6692(+)
MADAKYFSSAKKGEIADLKAELNSTKKNEKKDAVKKVIAAMTIGKDVSSLFNDVIKCMQTDNLELKKLVYLYLMNYAKSSPEDTILAVNSFVKDCADPNPLIRALAVRTMGCIRVHKITEYLCDPLRKCLKDDDPYVRKTAAVCVAKLYDIDQTLVLEQGFIESLQDLLSDANPMVVANAVAALSEMHECDPSAKLFDMNPGTVSKLLTALNECTEWGQIFILDSLALYVPEDQRELQSICERVSPRLQHVNAAVVLSAVKVIMKLLAAMADEDYKQALLTKLAPPLVTLLSSEPEIQYVALRNINLVVQKYNGALVNHMKVFFVKYNDPIYVKLEKLDVMIRLANDSNIQQVLAELKEYATEVDVDFVRKSVRAIGRCAIKVAGSAQRCVDTLLDLIQTKVNYVVQEAIVVIKDIFRKYPNKYESIIGTLCENLDTLDEPDAKAAMIWIVGEYSDRIDNADELLDQFIGGFKDEDVQVQLQILTATVKLFLKKPAGNQELVQRVLGLCTQESDDPDLRDRGFIYWRLLLTDPNAAKAVVLCEKPLISEETDLLEPSLLDELLCHISSLAAVYHKPPSTFTETRADARRPLAGIEAVEEDLEIVGERPSAPMVDLLGGGGGSGAADLLGLGLGGGDTAATAPSGYAGFKKPVTTWVTTAASSGLQITGTFGRANGNPVMEMTFSNQSSGQLSDFAVQFDKNSFKLINTAPLAVAPLAPGASCQVAMPINTSGQLGRQDPLNKLNIAFKATGLPTVTYMAVEVPYNVLLVEDGRLEKQPYLALWGEIAEETTNQLNGVPGSTDDIMARCRANNVFDVAKRNVAGNDVAYFSMRFVNGLDVLAELTMLGGGAVKVALKAKQPAVTGCAAQVFKDLLEPAPTQGLLF